MTQQVRRLIVIAVVLVALCVAGPLAKKPVPPSDNWYCAISFADRDGDLVTSDARGAYANGVDLVTCEVYGSSGGHPGDLHFQPQRNSTRRLVLAGQTYEPGGVAYDTTEIYQSDFLEIGQLRSATGQIGQTYLRPFRVTKDQAGSIFRGDSFATGTLYDSASSVFVTPLDTCSWDVEFNPTAPLVTQDAEGRVEPSTTWTGPRVLALITYSRRSQTLSGHAPLPFKARIDVIGNKPGCPLQEE